MAIFPRAYTQLFFQGADTHDDAKLQALKLFHKAAQRVPAYKDFLRKHRVDPGSIRTLEDFKRIPPTDKPSYINAYSLEELSWDGKLHTTRFVSSSSGSTGIPYVWPRGEEQNRVQSEIFQKVFEHIFNTKHGTTLFLDLFALGPWIAGLEFYNAAKFTADAGSNIAVATPSFEKNVALDTIKRIGKSFDRIVLAGYPPFVKDLLESGAAEGIDWSAFDVYLFTGGESFSETWRSRILSYLGKDDPGHVINLYGMAEVGVVGHETPLTIALRRAAAEFGALAEALVHEGMTAAVYQYDPFKRYLEIGEDSTVMLTASAGLPLVRYNTRDQGGLLSHMQAVAALGSTAPATRVWDQPLVYLFGRRDLSLTFYALNIYIENIKFCLESFALSSFFSGLFIMRIENDEKLDQRFELVVELARGIETVPDLAAKLTKHVVEKLCTVNIEYSKLHDSLQTRADPYITFVPYGGLDTLPGRKHRWVKRL